MTGTRPARVAATSVRGVTLHRLTVADEPRGTLLAGEFGQDIPFLPKRYFMVFGVPGHEVRGEHAHRRCQQFLVCVRGSVRVAVDDGTASQDIELNAPDMGLFVPAMTWARQFNYSEDAILLVFASEHYDPSEYVTDYNEFKRLAAAGG